jgi:AcrR family transcriptional regulator
MTKVTEAYVQARRERIREAALRVFARTGVERARIEEIAAEAGVSYGTVYQYYPSKETLLQAVIEHWMAMDQTSRARAAEGTDSPRETLLRMIHLFLVGLQSGAYREHVLVGMEAELAAARRPETLGATQRAMRQAELGITEDLVRRAQAAGEIDPAVDARALAVLMNAIGVGLFQMVLSLDDEVDHEAMARVTDQFFQRFAIRLPDEGPEGVRDEA